MGEHRRFRKDIPQISTERCASRKETLQQLLKLTNEITSTFNREKGGVCRKPLNGFPDPPKRPFTKSAPTATMDGKPGMPRRMPMQTRRLQQQQQQQMMMSRGPALNPTGYRGAQGRLPTKQKSHEYGEMAYRAMMKLCDQLERDVVTSAAGDTRIMK